MSVGRNPRRTAMQSVRRHGQPYSFARNSHTPKDTLVTHCKVCPFGVFEAQPHEWVSTPLVVGIIHTACKERLNND